MSTALPVIGRDKRLRKHRSQMRDDEIQSIESAVHAVRSDAWQMIHHASEREKGKSVERLRILETLRSGRVIEVNSNAYPDVRALFRREFGTRAVCVVVSLVTLRVVTVWANAASDEHDCMREAFYRWEVDATELCCLIPQPAAGMPCIG